MTRRETPPEWSKLLSAAGMSSLRQLAAKAEVSPSAVTRLVHQDGASEEETVRAIAAALRTSATKIRKLAGLPEGTERTFEIPPEADRLSPRQQRAIQELIVAIAESRPAATSIASAKSRTRADRDRQPQWRKSAAYEGEVEHGEAGPADS